MTKKISKRFAEDFDIWMFIIWVSSEISFNLFWRFHRESTPTKMYRIARADDASFQTVVSVNKRAWFDGLIELRVNRFENSLKLHWICFLLSFYATAKQCARNPWSKSSKRNVQITGNSTKLHRMFVVQILSGTKRRQASVSFVVMSTLEVVLINSEIRSITFPADHNRFINSTIPAFASLCTCGINENGMNWQENVSRTKKLRENCILNYVELCKSSNEFRLRKLNNKFVLHWEL